MYAWMHIDLVPCSNKMVDTMNFCAKALWKQWNLYNKDAIGTTINCPVDEGVPISKVFYILMSMQGMSDRTKH